MKEIAGSDKTEEYDPLSDAVVDEEGAGNSTRATTNKTYSIRSLSAWHHRECVERREARPVLEFDDAHPLQAPPPGAQPGGGGKLNAPSWRQPMYGPYSHERAGSA